MKIYTKTGDKGETGLLGGSRVPKNDPRIMACGDIDELNSTVGLVLAALESRRELNEMKGRLLLIERELFELGAAVADPREKKEGNPFQNSILRLEEEIDTMTRSLVPLQNFILPGGSEIAARLFLARAVCRRAERQLCALPGVSDPIVYLNRLSDYLFTAARWANFVEKKEEIIWEGRKK